VDLRRRFPVRIWRPAVDDEVEAEFQFHLEMRTRELVARGMSEGDARRAALDRFGDVTQARRTCRALGHQREQHMRMKQYLVELIQDAAFALRQMLAAPGFSAVAIVTLAIGIGATTAIFSALDAVALRPLPVPAPDRVVHVSASSRVASEIITDMGLPNAHFLELAAEQQAFQSVAAIRWAGVTLDGDQGAERILGARVTAGFFDVYGVQPAVGSVFGPAHDEPGRDQVAVLSHRLWTQRFGGDPTIVGRDILVNRRPHTVLGVMPPSFMFTAGDELLWTPMALTPAQKEIRSEHTLTVVARLRDGTTLGQANAHVAAIAERRREREPDGPERWLHVSPLLELYVRDYDRVLYVLLGAVGCVLLIGCGNVSNLLLARGTSRARELAVRSALGAGQWRLARQLFTENLVLGAAAAVAGAGLAYAILAVLLAQAPPGVPRLETARIDALALAVATALALAAALAAGLVPAWRAASADVSSTLKDGGRGAAARAGRDRMRSSLITAEVALALVLLVGAGLLIRAALDTRRVDLGFNPAGLYSGRVLFPAAAYDGPDAVLQVSQRLEEAAAAIPGVRQAALAHVVPSIRSFNNGLVAEGRPNTLEFGVQIDGIYVSNSYFETMGQRILQGRAFEQTDRAGGPPVTVINETMARVMWPGEDPIGKRVHSAHPSGLTTVIGVAADVRAWGPGQPPPPIFYLALSQLEETGLTWINRSLFIVARADGDPGSLAPALGRMVAEVAPGVPFYNGMTLEQRLAGTLLVSEFITMLLTALGLIGLLLAAVGIYGVLAYYGSQRAPEIGIRMALGASKRSVVQLMLTQAARPVLAGVFLGAIGAWILLRTIDTELVQIRRDDPMTFLLMAGGLCLVALAAAYVPARRAAWVDPAQALHCAT
jgi:putative ABC transport system permease protein